MNNYLFSFEKLEVWQSARTLIKDIYKLTKSFPSDERFGLTSQIRRCSVSIAANLAEGNSRNSPKDQAHFTNISISSLYELLNHIIISCDLEMISEMGLQSIRDKVYQLNIRLRNLRDYQLSKQK